MKKRGIKKAFGAIIIPRGNQGETGHALTAGEPFMPAFLLQKD